MYCLEDSQNLSISSLKKVLIFAAGCSAGCWAPRSYGPIGPFRNPSVTSALYEFFPLWVDIFLYRAKMSYNVIFLPVKVI